MTKKLTWEVEKTSLVIRIADGNRKTEWTLRENTAVDKLRGMLGEMLLELQEAPEVGYGDWARIAPNTPMIESVRTVDAEELAELQRYQGIQADSEEASRAAQAAQVAKLNEGAKWFEAEDDIYPFDSVQVQDYDAGEV